MKAFCFSLQLACLVLITLVSIPGYAEQNTPKPPLLGKLENNRYIAPENLFSVNLPFAQYEPDRHLIHDGILPGSLNVLMEDKPANLRYRIELNELAVSTPEKFEQAVENRLTSYRLLLDRVFDGSPVAIHFASPAKNTREYYFRQDGQHSHYHLFVFFIFNKQLAMLWTDFTENNVTPALEDSIINGEHPFIQATHSLYESFTKQ